MQLPDEREMQSWKILLVGQGGAELLLFRSATGLLLPELRIPRFERPAPLLNREAERLWGFKTVCVSPLQIEGADLEGSAPYYVMEVLCPEGLARMAPRFAHLSAVKEASFGIRGDYEAVRQVLGGKNGEATEKFPEPFSRTGSFRRISSWVEEQLDRSCLRWDGGFSQLQADSSFALIRFSTSHGGFWFKAVGEPNLREFPVTLALSERFPRHIPRPLAVCPEWNAWLTPEAEGRELSRSGAPADWYQAAASLAELQAASLQQAQEMLAAGARDLRCAHLAELAGPFFCAMEETMEAQTRPGPYKLGGREIAGVCSRVKQALGKLEDTGIPDTLIHLDLNPDNVFIAESRSTFLDWAEAGVGNPFLGFEYLRQHFLRKFPGAGDLELRDSYRKAWRRFLSDTAIENALLLAPLVAVFAYASALPWNDRQQNPGAHLAGYLRGMVRRMVRESERLECRAA